MARSKGAPGQLGTSNATNFDAVMCVCVCVCVRERERESGCMWMWMWVSAW